MIVTSDSCTISYTDPDGAPISAFDISVENTEITSDLSLQRNENGAWVSGGTMHGKDIAPSRITEVADSP